MILQIKNLNPRAHSQLIITLQHFKMVLNVIPHGFHTIIVTVDSKPCV